MTGVTLAGGAAAAKVLESDGAIIAFQGPGIGIQILGDVLLKNISSGAFVPKFVILGGTANGTLNQQGVELVKQLTSLKIPVFVLPTVNLGATVAGPILNSGLRIKYEPSYQLIQSGGRILQAEFTQAEQVFEFVTKCFRPGGGGTDAVLRALNTPAFNQASQQIAARVD